MNTRNGMTCGWLDSSIAALLQYAASLSGRAGYLLVTSVDSSSDLSTLRKALEITRRYPAARFIGTGLLLPSSKAVEISGEFGLFTGFDEVWWFDEAPALPKPDDVLLLPPLDLATHEIPAAVVEWMRVSKCKLGMGDGVGLNYVTPEAALAELLERSTAT